MKVGSIINVPSYISLNNTYLSFRGKSHKIDNKKNIQPRSNMYAGKRSDPMDFRKILEAVFQPELSRILSDDFRSVPTGKHRQ